MSYNGYCQSITSAKYLAREKWSMLKTGEQLQLQAMAKQFAVSVHELIGKAEAKKVVRRKK